MRLPVDIYDLIFLAGVAAVVYGLWLIYVPAAWIAGGVGLVAASLAGGARKGAAQASQVLNGEQESEAE